MGRMLICLTALALFACETDPPTGCEVDGCGPTQTCNAASGECEELRSCTGHDECGPSQKCLDHVCSSCTTNIVCTAGYTACDPETVACTPCFNSSSCGGSFPLCNSGRGCSACLSNADCSGATPHCAQPYCVACTVHADCGPEAVCRGGACTVACDSDTPCATGHCVNAACAECRTTEDCAQGLACNRGVCRPPLPGDSCRNPIPILLGAGEALVHGDASSWFLADSEQLSSSSVLYDVWYSVTVTEEQALNASVTSPSGSTSLEIRAWGDEGNPCSGRVLKSALSKVENVFVMPGTYLIRLSSWSSNFGSAGIPDYTLAVWTTPDSRALGNDCLKMRPLAVPRVGPSELVLSDDLSGLLAMPQEEGCYQAVDLPDLAYSFELDSPSGIEVTLTSASPELELGAAMSARCGEYKAYCYTYLPGPRTFYFKRPAGKQVLHVYSLEGAGPFEMKVKVVPEPENATCESASPITFVDDAAVLEGYPRYVPGKSIASCRADATSEGLHYRFSTVGTGARSLDLRALAGMPAWALHPSCRTALDQQATYCTESFDQVPDLANLPEGEYVLSVTEYSGYFRLAMALGPPYPSSANETCSTAQTVTLNGGAFSFSGDTRGAASDGEPQCDPRIDGGRDLFYTLPLTGKGRLTATLTPTSPNYDPVLMVASDTCTFAFNDACSNAPGAGATESVNLPVEPWGGGSEVNFWIDGDGASSGSFEVTGTFTPAPADDVCASPTPLPLGSTVTGDLSNYFKETGSRPCSLGGGGDRWYRFNPGNLGSVTLQLTANGFDGGVAVMRACDYSWGAVCDANAYSAPADAEDSVTFSVSKNTDYLVAVYATKFGGSGTYSLRLSAP